MFTAIGLSGLLVGTKLARLFSVGRLQQLFALFVLGLGLILLVLNIPKVLL